MLSIFKNFMSFLKDNKAKDKEIRRDIITITSDNTFGFFVTECKRDKLSMQEIEKINKIRLTKNVY